MTPGFTMVARLWDPTGGSPRAEVRVLDGRIERIDRSASASRATADAWSLPEDLCLLPGFTDGHTHLLSVGLAPLRPDLNPARSRQEALEMLGAWLEANPGEAPVIGEGWDQSLWPDPNPFTRDDLDRIAPRRALALRRVCGHIAVLNTEALRLLGGDWPDLDRESGLAREELPLALHRLWPPTEAQFDTAVGLAQEEAWKRGVTGAQEMGHRNSFRAFARAAVAGRLQLRVTHFFGVDLLDSCEALGLVPGFGDDRLRVGGVKIFLDGSFGGRSAAVRRPYLAGEGTGRLLWEDGKLRDTLRRACLLGFQPALHAIGERAIEQAVSAAEALRAEGCLFPSPGPRLEHAEELGQPLLARAVEAGFLFSMQPNFTARWQHRGELYESVLGWERAEALNPYARVAASGRLHFGSDTMPLDPWLGLRGATSHPLASSRLDLAGAIRHYTAGPAGAVSRPFGRGLLAEGEPADMTLVRWRPLIRSPEQTTFEAATEPEVLATWVGGLLCHLRSGLVCPETVPRLAR